MSENKMNEILSRIHKLEVEKSKLQEEYDNLKLEKYKVCDHLVTTFDIIDEDYDSHRRVYYGCVKCGLNNQTEHSFGPCDKVMRRYLASYDYRLPGTYFKLDSIYFYVNRDFNKARKITLEELSKNPNITNIELISIIREKINEKDIIRNRNNNESRSIWDYPL